MRTIEQMISQEVHYCVSSLVSTLAGGYGANTGDSNGNGRLLDLESLFEQAGELACNVDDWQSAAEEAGWTRDGDGFRLASDDYTTHDPDDWQELCEQEDIEPHQIEIFEHWIVSDWLADKLAEQGEKVDKDFAGLTVWARTTTGQAIAADSVIERIYATTHTS